MSKLLRCILHASRTTLPTGSLSGVTRSSIRSFTSYPAVQGRLRTKDPSKAAAKAAKNATSVLKALSTEQQLFKTYKPVTPGLRHLRRPITPGLYTGRPVKHLTVAKRKTGGRNNSGRITVRHIGGGHRRRLRKVDFNRTSHSTHEVIRIEHDPGRSAHLALLRNQDSLSTSPYTYILAPEGLQPGDTVVSFRRGIPDGTVTGFQDSGWLDRPRLPAGSKSERKITAAGQPDSVATDTTSQPEVKIEGPDSTTEWESDDTRSLSIGLLRSMVLHPGYVLPLRLIPPGTDIHAISLKANGPAILVRSAGTSASIVSHEDSSKGGKYTQVRMQSGEIRRILSTCCATIGRVGNVNWKDRSLGKAGRSRNLGKRPKVRGMAMNAVDHPHGGGRGKSKGNKQTRSIWGWKTKGRRTRRPGPKGNQYVVKQRPRGKEKRGRK